MENRFSSVIYSILVHAGLLALFVFSMNFSVPDVPEKFKVMVYDIPKSVLNSEKPPDNTSLLSDRDSSGASKFGEEVKRPPMRGLKKGINEPETPPPLPSAKAPSLPVPSIPPLPPLQGKSASSGRAEKTVPAQKGKSSGVDKKALNKEGIYKGEKKGIDKGNEGREKGETIPEDKKKELERLLAAVRKTPPVKGSKGSPPAFGIDEERLSRFAGIRKGLGGEDEEGEGGIGTLPSTGKIVSLDTKDFKYFSYFRHIKELIEGVWVYPKVAKERGIAGSLVIQFTIDLEGNLVSAKVLKSSGYFFLDDAAVGALRDASPYPPLPKRWKQDSVTIAGNFTYFLYGLP